MAKFKAFVKIRPTITAERRKGNRIMSVILSSALLLFTVLFIAIITVGNMKLGASDVNNEFNQTGRSILITAEVRNQSIQKKDGENSFSFFLPVKLSLTNSTDRTVLIIKKAVDIVGVRFAGSKSDLEQGVYIYERYTYPSFKQESISELQITDADEIEVLLPEVAFEMSFNEWFYLVEKESDNSLGNELSLEKLQKTDSLWLEFEVAMFPTNTMLDEGNKLKASWKKRGCLLLDTVTTRPIQVSVPQIAK
jgi:hypothetical protein